MKAYIGRRDNEISCWTVAVGNFVPFLKKSRLAIEFIKTLDGFVGVHPCPPRGTLILFRTESDAKIARNLMEAKGIVCGKNICECYVDKKYVEVPDNA